VIRKAAVVLAVGALLPGAVVGQGLPFHTPSALTTAFEQRGVRIFTMAQRRGDVTASMTPVVILPYAPHRRVTTVLSAPFLRKWVGGGGAPGGAFTNTGVGDVTLSVKWAFFARDRFAGTSRLALVVSGALPTGSTDRRLSSGQLAPRPLQLGAGSGAVGTALVGTLIRNRWGLSSSVGYGHRRRDGAFQAGGTARYDVAVGLRFPEHVETIDTRTLQLYVEWNGTVTRRSLQAGTRLPDSGGHVAYLSPGLQLVVLPRMMVEGSVQIPVVQDLNGAQARVGVRPALGLRYLFF